MSSTYRAWCMFHDPAIRVEGIETPHRSELEEILAKPIRGHEHCDLIGTRTSGSLIEVYCPPGTKSDRRPCRHTTGRWIDVVWARLLLVAHSTPLEPELAAAVADAHRTHSCWPYERANRLRVELDVATTKDIP